MASMATSHCKITLNPKFPSKTPHFFTSPTPIPSSLSFNPKPLIKPLKLSSHLHSTTPSTPSPQNPIFTFLKTTSITLITTTLFLSHTTKPSLATPISSPPTLQSQIQENTEQSNEEKETFLQEYVDSNPTDIQGLKALMGIKIQVKKFQEAITIIEKLIQLEPLEKEWPLMKAHVYNYTGDIESAKLGFEQVISENPLSVEAYHGLIMAAAQSDELGDVIVRIEDSMEKCRKEKKKEDYRDFKLLKAQVRVVEGKYSDALKVYEELVKEEPRDFRPYLCQGIVYTLLRKQDEAEKQFEKYRRLVPQGHPYASFFEDNMLATKRFSQMGAKR